MGRLMNLAIAIGAIGTAYVAFAGPIQKAWASFQNDINKITGPHVSKINMSASANKSPPSTPISITLTCYDSQGNGVPKIPVSLKATDFGPGSSQVLQSDTVTTDDHGQAVFTISAPFSTYFGGITVDATVGTVSDSIGVSFDSQLSTPGPGTTPPPPPITYPTVTFSSSLSVSPDTVLDGQAANISWQLQGGSGKFSGQIDFGDGVIETLDPNVVLQGEISHVYKLGNSSQDKLLLKMSIVDQATRSVYAATGNITVNPALAAKQISKVIIYSQPVPGFWTVDLIFTDGTKKSYYQLSTANVQYWISQGGQVQDLSGIWYNPTTPPSNVNIVLTILSAIAPIPDLNVEVNVKNNAPSPNTIDLQVQIVDSKGNTVAFPKLNGLTLGPNASQSFQVGAMLSPSVGPGSTLSVKVFAVASGTGSQVATPVSDQIIAA